MKEFCEKNKITEEQFYGRIEYKGSLDLNHLTSIPECFNPTVMRNLHLNNLTSIPDGFNPTVGGSLYLNNLTSIPEVFNPTVGYDLYLSSLTSIPEVFNPTVGGSLDLSSITSIPECFNPTVGCSLFLNSLTSITKGFNPTVGGSLFLSSITSIPDGFNPTVGRGLYLNNLTYKIIKKEIPENFIFSWKDGKYIKVDGIFSEVISKKKNIWKVKSIGCSKNIFLVTDGEKFSHGNTIKEARESLMYKISNRDKSVYNNLTLASKLSLSKMIECYRVITGACETGVRNFLLKVETKKDYSIQEVIKITNGSYGNEEFKKFFAKE